MSALTRTRRTGAGLALVLSVASLAGCGDKPRPDWTTQTAHPAASASASASGSASAQGGDTATASADASATAVATAQASSVTATTAAAVSQPPASDVQAVLQDLNYDIQVTGKYDAQTIAVVKKFQAKHGLPATGVVDAATEQMLLSVSATFKPTTATTDSDGLVFDGVWWSAGDYYRSKNRQCVVYEQQWQQAVEQGVKSAAVTAHDKAASLGCKPDVWTPNGIAHEKVNEKHADGDRCTAGQAGQIATGNYPWAVCNQVTDNVWRWKVMSS